MKRPIFTHTICIAILSICSFFLSNKLQASEKWEEKDNLVVCCEDTPNEGLFLNDKTQKKESGNINTYSAKIIQGERPTQHHPAKKISTSSGGTTNKASQYSERKTTFIRVARRESLPQIVSVSRKYYVIALRRLII